MSKPYIPTFDIIIRRSFDGKVEGERSWKLSAAGSYVDKLEDAIAFVADTAMDAYGLRTAASTPETPAEPTLTEAVERLRKVYRPAVPEGHFWRGEPEINRHWCRNCSRHYDEHTHTDEATLCPTANRKVKP